MMEGFSEEVNGKKEPVMQRPGGTFCRANSSCKGPNEAVGLLKVSSEVDRSGKWQRLSWER